MSQNRKEVAQKFARQFDGRAYGNELTVDEAKELMEANCVAIFGASDDIVEVRGAIDEEVYALEGAEFLIVRDQKNGEIEILDFTNFDGRASEKYFVIAKVSAKYDDPNETHDWSISDNSQQSAHFEVIEHVNSAREGIEMDGESNFCHALVIAL